MGSPTIFKGKNTALLPSGGILKKDGHLVEHTGLINYIGNDSARDSILGWSTYDDGASSTPVDGTGGSPTAITLSKDTTSKVRGETSLHIAKSAADGQGEGISYDFELSEIDKNRLLRISCEIASNDADYVAGDMGVYLISDTGGSPKVLTQSITDIAAGNSVFEALVSSEDAASMRLCIHCKTTNANAYDVYVANIKVTPELTVTATPVTEDIVWTPASTTYSGATWSIGKCYYQRVGNRMRGHASLKYVSGAISGSIVIILTDGSFLPDGLNVDLTNLDGTSPHNVNQVGSWGARDENVGSGVDNFSGTVELHDSGFLQFNTANGDIADATDPFTWANDDPNGGDQLSFSFDIPIAEWAGSVVTTANSRVEYAWNSSTTTTSDTSDNNYAYGPDGKEVESFAPSGTGTVVKRIQFQTPILPTDKVDLQFSVGSTGSWVNVGDVGFGSFSHDGGTNYHGVFFNGVAGSDTKMDVSFFQGPYVGRAWSQEETNGTRWRVVKSSNPLGIGTGLATATQAGAITAYDEGPWNPTVTNGANFTGLTVSSDSEYVRVGSLVTCTLILTGTTQTAVNGYFYMLPSELPFTQRNLYNIRGSGGRFNTLINGPVMQGTTSSRIEFFGSDTGTATSGTWTYQFTYTTDD